MKSSNSQPPAHTILHGDNSTAARTRAVELLNEARQTGFEVTRIAAESLNLAQLEAVLGSESLFAAKKMICVEHLHSLPPSKRKTELIEHLSQAGSADTAIVLLEKRALTATMLKKFAGAQVEQFPLAKALFSWLDSIQGNMARNPAAQKTCLTRFREAESQDGAVMCLVMAARQLRLLIQVTETGRVAGPPFLVSKLKKQATTFPNVESLVAAHRQLLEIDLAHKSGAQTTYQQDLDLWLLSL